MKKRILSLLLALCMIAGMLPVIALAEDTATQPSIRFNYEVPGTSTYKVMNAGDAPIYWKTGNFNTSEPDTFYMAGNGTESDWNVKLEYPLGGIPTMTLKDAKIVEGRTLTFVGEGSGAGSAAFAGDVKLILEGDNYISCNNNYTSDIYFNITGTATIAGPGKLKIEHSLNSSKDGIIHSLGGLVLDHANIDINIPSVQSRSCHGVDAENGDLIIKGGNLSITGFNSLNWANGWASYRPLSHALHVDADANGNGGNLTIQDGANVKIVASCSNNADSNGRQAAETIYVSGKFTLKNSDIEFTTYGGTYLTLFGKTKVPAMDFAFDGGYTILSSADKSAFDPATNTVTTPDGADTFTNIADVSTEKINAMNYLKVTHGCVPGEPTYEDTMGTQCTKIKTEITNCTICGKETSRVEVEVENPEKVHTPGKVEEIEMIPASTVTTKPYAITKGKYVFKHTCAVCGETWTTEEEFEPALFDPMYSGKDVSDTFADLVLNPGQVKYFTTGQYDTNNPDYWYFKATTDTENWNVKFEYPKYGTPTITFKNAYLKNAAGIYYGVNNFKLTSDLRIVIEEDSYVELVPKVNSSGQSYRYNGFLNSKTTGHVTITGPGKLTIVSERYGEGVIDTLGDITLDHVNIELIDAGTAYGTSDIVQTDGDIVMKGGSINVLAYRISGETGYYTLSHGLYTTNGNITLQDGAELIINGTLGAYGNAGLHATSGNVTISESTYLVAHAKHGGGSAIVCGGTLSVEYANGYTIQSSNEYTTYSIETGEITDITYPAATTYTDISKVSLANDFFHITPNAPVAKFEAGAAVTVQNDLTLEFAIKAENIPAGSIAYITRGENTTEITLGEAYLEGAYYVIPCTGIAAKEMHDEVTVVIKSADGATTLSETKTDSVYDYLVRMLDSEQGEQSDAKYAALKTVLVDMLNYGTMAQVRFMHNTENLANAVLNPADWEHATADMLETPAVSANVVKEDGVTTSTHLGTTFELKTNISMLMAIDTTELGAGSYAKVYVDGVYKETVTAEDYTGYAVYTFRGMNASEGRKDIKWEFYTAEDVLKLTVTDSLAAYVGRNIDKYPYLADLMKYCDAAAAYFTTV